MKRIVLAVLMLMAAGCGGSETPSSEELSAECRASCSEERLEKSYVRSYADGLGPHCFCCYSVIDQVGHHAFTECDEWLMSH